MDKFLVKIKAEFFSPINYGINLINKADLCFREGGEPREKVINQN